jgi:hypothetical protein
MSELPALFDAKGVFVPLDASIIETMDEVRRGLYEAVANASELNVAADNALANAQADVRALVQRRNDLERYKRDNIKPPTFMDEWRASKRQRSTDHGR